MRRGRLYLTDSAYKSRPLAHPKKPESIRAEEPVDARDDQPNALVLDREVYLAGLEDEMDHGSRSMSVLFYVPKGLLADTEQRKFDRWIEPSGDADDVELRVDLRPATQFLGQPMQSGHNPEVLQNERPEVPAKPTEFVGHRFGRKGGRQRGFA